MEPYNIDTNKQLFHLPDWFSVRSVVKVFILLLLGGICLEIYLGFQPTNQTNTNSLLIKQNTTNDHSSIQPAGNLNLLLLSDNSIYKVGAVIPVKVQIATLGHTIKQADIVITYDTKMFDLQSNNLFIQGNVFSANPIISQSGNGIIKISGDAGSPTYGYNGVGVIGTLNFIAKKTGLTNININQPDISTNNSIVLDFYNDKNILEKTKDLPLIIQ